ncbi:hypothetical protein R3W88_003700 [Solanum pinnatisectum]|uniref:Uncharacterized protein n=1 Tax=Solanum pinnatisectum TaxID=50273 RepID=A0AAV9MPQ5_9SOLN|nr:hypothetical protein R3W88_003700 [Solanum pinnatisectum]
MKQSGTALPHHCENATDVSDLACTKMLSFTSLTLSTNIRYIILQKQYSPAYIRNFMTNDHRNSTDAHFTL